MEPRYRLTWPTPVSRIEHLQPNTPVRHLEMVVLRIYPKRLIVSPSYTGHVAAACGRDETGLVGLVLWGDQIQRVNVGDVIRLESGWCRSRDGALVVSTGKHGRLALVQPSRADTRGVRSRNHKEGEVVADTVARHHHE
jgi:ssDNA-binding replication factor A large subunit